MATRRGEKPLNLTPNSGRGADRHARWVAMWGDAVRTSPLAIGLVQLSTTRFVAMSSRAAELLRTTPERGAGLNYLSVTDRPREAAETFRLVREGTLDGLKGRRRFQRPNGSMVELQLTGWAIRSSSGPDLGLWIASEVSGRELAAAVGEVGAPARLNHAVSEIDDAQLTLDDRWRVAHISTGAGAGLDRPSSELLGSSIIELTHSDDLAALLLAFARATTDTSADVRIRLRDQDRTWRTMRATITHLEGDGTSPFSLVVAPTATLQAAYSSGASQLAGHLRRIASHIEAAGTVAPLIETAAALGVPATAELSPRQWEIASRLVRGERVATIAAELYLSKSTVRNHLSAIFQKFGVHSQPEFLALWRDGAKASQIG
jgi:DNA-binding CsgD family transcriptional regulator/PAS domain-containing protein